MVTFRECRNKRLDGDREENNVPAGKPALGANGTWLGCSWLLFDRSGAGNFRVPVPPNQVERLSWAPVGARWRSALAQPRKSFEMVVRSAARSKRRFRTPSLARIGLGLSLATFNAVLCSSVIAEPDTGLAPAKASVEFAVDPFNQHVIRAKEPEWQTLPYSFTFGQTGDITQEPETEQVPLLHQAEYAPVRYAKAEPEIFEPVKFSLGKTASEMEAKTPPCTSAEKDRLTICVDLGKTPLVKLGDIPGIVDFSADDFTVITSPTLDAAIEVQNIIISHGRAQKNGFETRVGEIPGCVSKCEEKVELSRLGNEGVDISHAKP